MPLLLTPVLCMATSTLCRRHDSWSRRRVSARASVLKCCCRGLLWALRVCAWGLCAVGLAHRPACRIASRCASPLSLKCFRDLTGCVGQHRQRIYTSREELLIGELDRMSRLQCARHCVAAAETIRARAAPRRVSEETSRGIG